jgi:ankyrin repeat protein
VGDSVKSYEESKWNVRHSSSANINDQFLTLSLHRFRWVALQLEALSRCHNMGALLQTLSTLPTTLDETYTRILQQIEEYERPHVRRILQWVCFSAFPLKPVQLAEIHRIGGNICPPFSPHDVLFQAEDIFAICPGFLTVTLEEEYGGLIKKVVQLAHFSVKEYLLSPRASSWGFTELESHISIIRASIAYFLYMASQEKCDQGSSPLFQRLWRYPLAHYASRQCNYHLDFITPRDHPDLGESFHALLDPKSAPLLVHNLGFTFLEQIAHGERFYPHARSPESLSLVVAAELGLSQTLRWLLSFESFRDWVDADVTREWDTYTDQNTASYWPLLCASRRGHADVMRLLIEMGADVDLNRDGTALGIACQQKQLESVKVLLEHGADAESPCALWWSCYEGFEEGVRVLLDAGVNVNYDDGRMGNALQAAIIGRWYSFPRIVQILLDAGAEVNTPGNYTRSALGSTTDVGSKEVVQVCLAAGAGDIKHGSRGESALQTALSMEEWEIVRMLLNSGACIDEIVGGLQRASRGGHVAVVQMMLEAGANVNQVGGEWGTALQAASYGGHVPLVQQLLNAGADVDQVGGTYGNALTAAASSNENRQGSLVVVQMLLDVGAEVNQKFSGEYGNPLQAAAESGNTEVVRILLNAGADVNAYGGKWGSALQAASCMGHEETVRVLLQAGARANQ